VGGGGAVDEERGCGSGDEASRFESGVRVVEVVWDEGDQ